MNIQQSTESYETWLKKHLIVIPGDLKRKHQAMAEDAFSFFRATFYRWMQHWPEVCPGLDEAPKVLAVGDLHVENFGTWRDVEGRLVWGINDFDEAAPLPYTLDLVRLAVSAHMAVDEAHLKIEKEDACKYILDGYREGLSSGGRPFVLSESNVWLRELVHGVLRDPAHFWAKMETFKPLRGKIPAGASKGIARMMPARASTQRVSHRVAGLGSLGRERYVAVADYAGGRIAREAKALAPSACGWAEDSQSRKILYQQILDRSIRCIDPFVKLKGKWIVRRLAPDCSRVELAQLPKEREESKLLFAMGFETANVHLGSAPAVKLIVRDFAKRPKKWLQEAASQMNKIFQKDWEAWKS